MSHRFRFPVRLLLAVCLCLTYGCGRDPYAGKVPLRYMAWGNPEQMSLEERLCEEFNHKNPDIHVSFLKVPGDEYGLKMMLMLSSHTAPDVMRVDHYNFPSLVEKGYFLDLTNLAAKDPTFHRSDFFPQAIQECLFKDHLYGLNVLFGGNLIYYNKNMFREAGLEDPAEMAKQGRWKWDEFRKCAIKMTKKGADGRPIQFGFGAPGSSFTFPGLACLIWGYGGDMLDKSLKHAVFDCPGAIKAFQMIADFRWKDHCCPTQTQGENSIYTFEGGKLGMVFDFMGLTPRYRKVIHKFQWDVCPVPRGPFGNSTLCKGNQLVIFSETAHPAEAWGFERFMTSEATEDELYVKLRRCFPTRKAMAYSPGYLKSELPPFNNWAFVDAVEHSRPLPINDRWSEWTTEFDSEIDNLIAGREHDAAAVLRRAKKKVDKVLAEEAGF